MSEITVSELKQKRTELEQELSVIVQKLLNQFVIDTGVSIDNVYIYSRDGTGMGDKHEVYICNVSVELVI